LMMVINSFVPIVCKYILATVVYIQFLPTLFGSIILDMDKFEYIYG
jgi:hypothetical protein